MWLRHHIYWEMKFYRGHDRIFLHALHRNLSIIMRSHIMWNWLRVKSYIWCWFENLTAIKHIQRFICSVFTILHNVLHNMVGRSIATTYVQPWRAYLSQNIAHRLFTSAMDLPTIPYNLPMQYIKGKIFTRLSTVEYGYCKLHERIDTVIWH